MKSCYAWCFGATLLAATVARAASAPVEITECGAVFLRPTTAFLGADLDCSAWEFRHERPIIKFLSRGVLELRGFTVTGSFEGASGGRNVVYCEKNCRVYGNGGRIRGGTFSVGGAKKVEVFDAEIADMSHRGVIGKRVRIENVSILRSGTEAVTGARVIIRNSLISENGGTPQPDTGLVRLTSAVIFGATVRVFDSTITNNAWGGIEVVRARVENSTVVGNGAYFECGVTRNCGFDVGSRRRARVIDSVCGHSLDMTSCACNGDSAVTPETDPQFHNWAVCANDPP